MSRSDELLEKAKALNLLVREVKSLASDNEYGVEIDSDGEIRFNDWLSSSCYGEGDDSFTVYADGSVWMSSSC